MVYAATADSETNYFVSFFEAQKSVKDRTPSCIMSISQQADVCCFERDGKLTSEGEQYVYEYNNSPILNETNGYTVFPIKHRDLWNIVEKHRKMFWVETDFDAIADKADWEAMTDNERHFIKYILAFFAASDGIVLENLAMRFYPEVQFTEAKAFYVVQMFMEFVHSVSYSILIDTYIDDPVEKDKLFNAIEHIPSIRDKAQWAQKWIAANASFAQRIVAFACVEGIFFSGAFCSIYYLKERGLMTAGLGKSNDLISKDEGVHCDYAIELYRNHCVKCPDEIIHLIVSQAVAIEESFITEALPCDLIGMNAKLMKQYIRFVANRLVKQLGHPEMYAGIQNPFSFMDRMNFDVKGNFFEKDITTYQITITRGENDTIDKLDFDADF